MTTPAYVILVNSSDPFEDCWEPFFRLFETFWPACEVPILLNTEQKPYTRPGLNLRATVVQHPDEPRLPWSECLIRALRQIETPLVLYFHEDYFLEAPVDAAFIDEMAARMLADPRIRHIGLTHFGSEGPFAPTDDERLWQIGPKARYRLNTQVGLWHVDTLLRYLRPEENAWMFEIFGSARARRVAETLLTTNRMVRHPRLGTGVVQYTHTGIIKGRWHPAMPALFAQHGLTIDFAQRGFFSPRPPLLRRWELLLKLAAHPLRFLQVAPTWLKPRRRRMEREL